MSRENGRSSDRPVAYKTSGERTSRSYRSSPSRSSTNRYSNGYEEHRSRRDEEPHSSCLSKFYRERFGSHSPEDYLNLRMSQFDRNLGKDDIRTLLEREFKALAPFEIKIVQNPENDGRLAYVNFEQPECAKIVRRNMVPRLQKVLGKRIVLDPTGVIRDQEGKFIPDRYNRAVMAAADRGRSPPSRLPSSSAARRRSPPPLSGNSSSTVGTSKRREGGNLNQVSCRGIILDDTQASRTIFVGNLPVDVRETELKRIFEIFGNIDHVDIKTLQDSNAAFAFILYQTVEEAIEARNCQHNKPIRPGSSRCQIGYGKSQQSHRLYVGGLGPWASYDLLMSEFERYGVIDYVEYQSGDKSAFVRFDSMDASIEACTQMKNFDLSGKSNHITVDYVKDIRIRKRIHSDSEDEYESKRRHGPRTPSLSPARSPTEAGYINTLEQLREQIASTWKGIITLKKTDCPLSLYRIFGREHMIQDYLRDEDGNALRLNIIQRLPIDVDYYKRTIELNKSELTLAIAVKGSQSVESLITYLKEKNAAGVINVQGGAASVHVLTYSPIAERLIKFFAPRIAVLKPGCNYLLIALKKTTGAANSFTPSFQPTLAPPPPEPTRLPPPPPLPFLVKHEVEESIHLPLREDRPAFQMQLKMKNESSSDSAISSTISAPPIPPELSPPSGWRNGNKPPAPPPDGGSESSSEGENDHRRPPAQQQHHQQLNQRRHRKDDEEDDEGREEDDEEPSSDDDSADGSGSDNSDDSTANPELAVAQNGNNGNDHTADDNDEEEEKEEGRISSDSSSDSDD